MKPEVAILSIKGSYAVDALVAQGDFTFRSVDAARLDLGDYTCPYGFPPVDRGRSLLLVSGWLKRLEAHGIPVVPVVERLRKRFDRIIGLDQMAATALDIPDEVLDHLDVVLKVNGVFKDRELYRYPVGSLSRSGVWSGKAGPQRFAYKRENLDKVQLSLPCFVANIPALRRRTRKLYGQPWGGRRLRAAADVGLSALGALTRTRVPRRAAHFLGALTHPQRADAVRLLKSSGLDWSGGITDIPPGTPFFPQAELVELGRQLEAEGLRVPRQNRVSYTLGILDCKAVVSITGIGEVCFRMAEAWAMHRILVCQDLTQIECLFPLIPGENVLYCKPDLTDLEALVRRVEQDYSGHQAIARNGYRSWQAWCAARTEVVRLGFAPLYALG